MFCFVLIHKNMTFITKLFTFLLNLNLIYGQNIDIEIDPNGYILYCSCMGRFGNQAEQLLGSLQFAKSLDRTLIVPPFIQYNHYKVEFIPFDNYIEVEPLQEYHRVITIENFMKYVAPIVWPEENRSIMCYSSRGFDKTGCNPFDGNPFKAFWDHLGIKQFPNGSVYHSPLLTDYTYYKEWKQRFKDYKVLAFVGAPSAFPTNLEAIKLQKYINLSQNVIKSGERYRLTRGFAKSPYLAIHLRHGSDWFKACDLLNENPDLHQLFSSTQCSPEKSQPLPYELCLPPFETIIGQIQQIVKESETKDKIQTIYIATDNNNETLWQLIHKTVPNVTLIAPTATYSASGEITTSKPPNLIQDIYLLSFANQFIGNCISSFSGFVSRYRIYNLHFKRNTHFFSEQLLDQNSYLLKTEL